MGVVEKKPGASLPCSKVAKKLSPSELALDDVAMTRLTLRSRLPQSGATGPKAITMGPLFEAYYDPMFSMGPCRVSQEGVLFGSRSVKATLQRCNIECCAGEVRSEQFVQVEWREHRDALEITTTGRTHFRAAKALFSGSMKVGQLSMVRLSTGDAAQSREGPCGEAAGTA